MDFAGSIVGGAEYTPAAEKALKAWLAANTPSQPGKGNAYTGNQTPGRMLATPAMQGLLQQLRISTPALGAQVNLSKQPKLCPWRFSLSHWVTAGCVVILVLFPGIR